MFRILTATNNFKDQVDRFIHGCSIILSVIKKLFLNVTFIPSAIVTGHRESIIAASSNNPYITMHLRIIFHNKPSK